MGAIKRALFGVKKKSWITNSVFTFLFSLLNAILTYKAADFVNIKYGSEGFAIIAAFTVTALLWCILEFIGDIHMGQIFTDIENFVGKFYFNKYYDVKPEVLKKNSTGYISSVVSKMQGYKSEAYDVLIAGVIIDFAYIGYVAVMLGMQKWWLGILAISVFCLSVIARSVSSKLLELKWVEILTSSEGERNGLFVDCIENIGTVQKMQASEFINSKMLYHAKKCWDDCLQWNIRHEIGFTAAKVICLSFSPIILSACLLFGVDEIVNSPQMLALLAGCSVQLWHNCKSTARFIKISAKLNAANKKLGAICVAENIRKPLSTEPFATLKIENADYSYNDKETQNRIRVQIPEFKLHKGDKVCVYGESGQGKTTLLNIASQEIETDNVILNGKRVAERLDCVFISQDTEMLDMTLYDNLTLGKDIPKYKVVEMLEAVGLGDWFSKQEKGLNTVLGERGVYVSTGQRQRLNLIRGLLMPEKEVYFLDEPTSNVDEDTEAILIDLLEDKLKDKTFVVVTHRLGIKQICNKFYKFEGGICREVDS